MRMVYLQMVSILFGLKIPQLLITNNGQFSTSKSSFQKEARFEVLDNQNHVFFTSDSAIFKVTNAVPNPATVTQNDVGDVVISPGAGKT